MKRRGLGDRRAEGATSKVYATKESGIGVPFYRRGYVLTDFDDFDGGFGVSKFGEVVSSACEFQEEGSISSGFQRT